MNRRDAMRKAIPGLAGYEADDQGQIWKVAGLKPGFQRHTLRPHVGAHGYLTVRVFVDGVGFTKTIHPLVARAFHGEKPAGCEARHLDGNRRNNRPENILWGTSKQNTADRVRHGRLVVPTARKGETHKLAKLNDSAVREIRRLHSDGVSYAALSQQFGVSATICRRVVLRKAWSHVE